MSDKAYMVASVSGKYMFQVSKIYRTEKGVMNAYKKAMEETRDENLRVLKAQWVDADFNQYINYKNLIENEREANAEK